MKSNILRAISVLKDGGIVIFPTDTAFGIGCRIDDSTAVDRLFRIRKRPRTQATPVLVSAKAMGLAYYVDPKDIVRRLMNTYWPGALTIISPCDTNRIYSPIRGGGNTIGLRMPNHQTTLDIISGSGVPILGPSANFHGKNTPYRFRDIDSELIKLVDFIVPGECMVGMASTVIDCSTDPYKVLRQGSVYLNTLLIDTSEMKKISVGIRINGKEFWKREAITIQKSQRVLPLLAVLMEEHRILWNQVQAIEVHPGPGSYTGLRVGFAVANALGYLLHIPVNNSAPGSAASPHY